MDIINKGFIPARRSIILIATLSSTPPGSATQNPAPRVTLFLMMVLGTHL